MLHEVLTTNTDEIIARTCARVATRTDPVPTEAALQNGVPVFLGQLADRLRRATIDSGAIEESTAWHGGELLAMGFTVSQVVHVLGDVCQVVTQLADETGASITAGEFNTFNRCIGDAIAHAVTEHERQRDASVACEETERQGVLAHELRDQLSAAMLAFTILQEAAVGIGGSTSAMLGRSLRGMDSLINNTLDGMRLDAGIHQHHRVSVAGLIGEAEVMAGEPRPAEPAEGASGGIMPLRDGPRPRILWCDDNADMRTVVQKILSGDDYTVTAMSDGLSALHAALDNPPDLVLSDVRMPLLDGLGLLRALRADERTRAVPVIFVSARGAEDAAIGGLAAGADDYLVKPFTAKELLARVRTHLTTAKLRRACAEEVDLALKEAQAARRTAVTASRAKSEFLAAMSHEIRTPMNAILGYAQLLRRDATLTGEQRRYVDVIGKSGEHLLDLINDVLEMSKIETGHREVNRAVIDLHGTLDDVARLLRVQADAKRLSFEVHRAPEVPRCVVGDEGKLRQILVNLLGNAMKFTEQGFVVARFAFREAELGDPRLHAEIQDTGPGIDSDELETLFQPFVQGRAGADTSGGTGLGLALSRQLARLMGGDITVESRVGEGSLFRFEVPLEVGVAPAAAPPPRRIVALAGANAVRLLVVDDMEHNRIWLCKLLEQIGFAVREAGNGAEALALLDTWSPHLVLMDMQMPVMDGYAATRAIRARPGGERTVVVALTASAFDEARDAIFAAGADGWLRKPCRESELLDEIARHLGVQYQYADAYLRSLSPATPMPAIRGALLPLNLAGELRAAAHVADYDHFKELLTQIPAESSAIADALEALLEQFAYEQIEVLLQP